MSQDSSKVAVVAALKPVSDLLGQAIPKANKAANDFFQPPGELAMEWCATTHSTIFRFHTRRLLTEQKYVVVDDDEVSFVADKRIPNVGLQVSFRGFEIKILKAGEEDSLPVAKTDSRADFYTQDELDLGDYTGRLEARVVYLWWLDENHAATKCWLVMPEYAEKGSKVVSEHWREPIDLATPKASAKEKVAERGDLSGIAIPTEEVSTGPAD